MCRNFRVKSVSEPLLQYLTWFSFIRQPESETFVDYIYLEIINWVSNTNCNSHIALVLVESSSPKKQKQKKRKSTNIIT